MISNYSHRQAEREAAQIAGRLGPLARTLLRGEDIWDFPGSPRDD